MSHFDIIQIITRQGRDFIMEMDFKPIRKEYETTKTSFKKLAEKYKIHYKKLERQAKEEGWIKYKSKPTPKLTKPPKISPKTEIDTQTPTNDIKELLKGYFQPIDNIMLELFIDTYVSYQELKKEVAKEGRFLKSSKGGTYYNPKYSALQMEKMNIMKIQKELGVTIASRQRLNIVTKKESNEPSIFDMIQDVINESDSIDI